MHLHHCPRVSSPAMMGSASTISETTSLSAKYVRTNLVIHSSDENGMCPHKINISTTALVKKKFFFFVTRIRDLDQQTIHAKDVGYFAAVWDFCGCYQVGGFQAGPSNLRESPY